MGYSIHKQLILKQQNYDEIEKFYINDILYKLSKIKRKRNL